MSGTITVPKTGTAEIETIEKIITFKNCAPFADCLREINNTRIDNVKDNDIVTPMYNLIEYSDNYSKTSGSLWKYYRDEPFLNANGPIADFSADDNNNSSFKFKTKVAGGTGNDGTENVKIMVPLKYLINAIAPLTLEMSLTNC